MALGAIGRGDQSGNKAGWLQGYTRGRKGKTVNLVNCYPMHMIE